MQAQNKKQLTAIGMMSGTSADGLDIAVITSDGEKITEIGPYASYTYLDSLKQQIKQAMSLRKSNLLLEKELTIAHINNLQDFIKINKINSKTIDVIGYHGQTITHQPRDKITLQIGDAQLLADSFGIDVIADLRSNDVKFGGQGAPLVPIYHQAILYNEPKPIACINIGGVANITYIDDNDTLIAFDTGPGNAFIDDIVHKHSGKHYDNGGEIAAAGTPDNLLVQGFLKDPYFKRKPPKSLDRNEFDHYLSKLQGLRFEDKIATLTDITSSSIALAVKQLPRTPLKYYICGGGRHNLTIMKLLRMKLGNNVHPIEHLGLNGDAIEAEAFAFLAVRSLKNMPITRKSTTGAKVDNLTGGVLFRAKVGK